jgi:hypothetical protein
VEVTISTYRKLLVKDDALEKRLARLSDPVLRIARILGIPAFCAILLYWFVAESGVSRFLLLFIVAVFLLMGTVQLKREHAIVAHYGKAVGTVFVHEKGWPRRGVRIEYVFLSADDKLYIGEVSGSAFPKEGQTIPVVYKIEDPSINLPVGRLWFFEFP